jgi:hypothetical protein
MIRVISLFLSLPVVTTAVLAAADAGVVGFVETFAAVALIVGFAIAAAGWAIRHDV